MKRPTRDRRRGAFIREHEKRGGKQGPGQGEELRKIRNRVVHKPEQGVTEAEVQSLFSHGAGR
eukprot:300084-Rhodomonas_salina.2